MVKRMLKSLQDLQYKFRCLKNRLLRYLFNENLVDELVLFKKRQKLFGIRVLNVVSQAEESLFLYGERVDKCYVDHLRNNHHGFLWKDSPTEILVRENVL